MRIDLILATRAVAEESTWTIIDRNARKGEQPSDHAPAWVELEWPARVRKPVAKKVAKLPVKTIERPGRRCSSLTVTS